MKLILFFNGWGMDNKAVEHLKIPKNYKIEIINFPYKVDNSVLKNYEKVIAVGWSFGSYYLSKYIYENKMNFNKVISINGVPETIGEFGIPQKIFNNTLKNLTLENLKEFYKNMGAENIFSIKNFQNIKEELQYFSDNYHPQNNIFDKAIIGKNDKIIPSLRQKKYYQKYNTDIKIIECSHYPFNYFNNWLEIIGDNEDEF